MLPHGGRSAEMPRVRTAADGQHGCERRQRDADAGPAFVGGDVAGAATASPTTPLAACGLACSRDPALLGRRRAPAPVPTARSAANATKATASTMIVL